MADLTADRLKQLLHYDPETGAFTRIACVSRSGNLVAAVGAGRAGEAAGWMNKSGYLRIYVAGRQVLAHRLAWLYVYGAWPTAFIDHINGDRSDNRIANLRAATAQQNSENVRVPRPANKTGLLGVVYAAKQQKYLSYIKADGRSRYLGSFETGEAAHDAYVAAKRELHEFATV